MKRGIYWNFINFDEVLDVISKAVLWCKIHKFWAEVIKPTFVMHRLHFY